MCGWLLTLLLVAAPAVAESQRLQTAREHVQKGRFDEALELYDELTRDAVDPARVAIGKSRALLAVGRLGEAAQLLQKAAGDSPDDASLLGRWAGIYFQQGQFDRCEKVARRALLLDSQQPRARLVLADVLAETGRLDEANDGYRWFVGFYNRTQPQDAETLLIVARGAVQYARWNGVSQVFDFVVNTLCPDALAADELSWQSHHLAGVLLLEKYNREQALPELRKALAINPRAAEVLVALGEAALQKRDFTAAESFADRALEINPALVPALQLDADIALANGRVGPARASLNKAADVNPHDQTTLAGIAACELLRSSARDEELRALLRAFDADGDARAEDASDSAVSRLASDLAGRNPRPGLFLTRLGAALESRRQFESAELLYRRAIAVMPQLSEPKTSLGMLFMRVGKIDEAEAMLDDAFEADPFHVRVANMRKVISLLEGYDTISTDHFVIRVDSAADRLLGRYMAEYLEEIYAELVEQFGFEPQRRTQFEIFHNASGISAHQWFSARMVGLPWIQTIGASTGMVVALASPTAAEEPFNWARVLKHEFVHVITLQQTKFNIPHWLTEALAVTSEGAPRPIEWNRMLVERVPAGELFTLDTLDQAFARPSSPDDWQFAYCQSRIYAQYMLETYGEDCIGRLLEAYRLGLTTSDSIQRVFGVTQDSFEAGYRRYLEESVRSLRVGEPPTTASLAELEEAHLSDPRDPRSRAAYAYGLLQAGRSRRAKQLATDALAAGAPAPLAAIVLSELELAGEDVEQAKRVLQQALDDDRPHSQLLQRLARLEFSDRKYSQAAELYELGRKNFPDDPEWRRGLAGVYWKQGDNARLKPLLEELAQQTPGDVSVRKKRAEIALAEEDYSTAIRFGRLALHIDVLDADLHAILGEAYAATGMREQAVSEFEAAVEVQPDDPPLELSLAKAYIAANRLADAKSLLEQVVSQRPDHAEARKLLETLD